MNDIAIVVGHTKLSPGACSPFEIECEFEFNSIIAERLSCVADIYYYDSYNLGYTAMVKKNAAKLNKKNYKLVLKLHYNAASPLANGTECLYYFANKKAKKLSEYFCEMFCAKFHTINRGAKALVSKKDRGFAAVFYPKATTLLLEPFFGSSKLDVTKMVHNKEEYADMIIEFIEEIKEKKLI
jgi:N-acetylmuramoyl-L-alanine amidase